MPVAEANGVRLNYVQMDCAHGGECEDLVMVHGLATNMAFWYFRYAPAFSSRYRVTLYDLRGHGRSGRTADGYSPANLAVDLEQLLDHLGIAQAHFIAHSFGGVIALNFACRNPERVASLILADTHVGAMRRLQPGKAWEYGKKLQPVLQRHGLDIDTGEPYFGYRLLTEVARLQLLNREIAPELLELLNPLIGQFGQRTANQWLQLMDTTAAGKELLGDDGLSSHALGELSFPIMAMYGENSQAISSGEYLMGVLPEAEFRRVRGGGHFFPTSRPDEVIKSCGDFWEVGLVNGLRRRKGETGGNHFRSSRVINRDGAWFLFTREYAELGPFTNLEDTCRQLDSYLSENVAG
jgi:pimeloyl-ACP methyl ester carboxylesterase